MDDSQPIHVLMRFADNLVSDVDTINEHKAVIANHGAVWIGKIGKALGEKFIDLVNTQCEEGTKTYLILVQKVDGKYEAFRGVICQMTKNLPAAEKKFVPIYYDNAGLTGYEQGGITGHVTLWTKLKKLTKMKPGELSGFKIASSGRPAVTTLKKSMAALFVIQQGKGFDY